MKPLTVAVLSIVFVSRAAVVPAAGTFHVEHSVDGFGMRSHGIIETVAPNRTKFYPLPQSTAQEYMRLKTKQLRENPFEPKDYWREEVIGPYQVEDGKIWFGNNYYASEGMRGVGAFGYFDTSVRKYTLFSPPEVAPYEVSAILVEPDVVWVALDSFVEDISTFPGGLILWDRSTHEVHRFPLEFVVSRIKVQGDMLRLTTRGGYALLRNEELQRYLNNGKPIKKFPPPPSHY